MGAIMEAQKARGVRYDTKNIFKKVALMVPVTVPLLVGSVKKTDAIAIGAELRGFNLRTRTSAYRSYPIRAVDIVVVVACVCIFAAALYCNAL